MKLQPKIKKLSLEIKVLFPICFFFSLGFAIALYHTFKEVEAQKRNFISLQIQELREDLTFFAEKAQENQQLARLLAQFPDIRRALKRRDRLGLLSATREASASINQSGVIPRYIHFHIPPGISFLRVWRPEIFGDDLSDFRHSVVTVLSTGTAVWGIEAGRMGIAARGVVPIYDQEGLFLGSVEVFSNLADLTLWLRKRKNIVNALYLHREINATAAPRNYHRLGEFWAVSPLPEPFSSLVSNAFLRQALKRRSQIEVSHYTLIGAPIKDFSGRNIAVYIRLADLSFVSTRQRAIIFNQIPPSVGFFIVSIGATIFLIQKGIFHPLNHLREEVREISRFVGKKLREPEDEVAVAAHGENEISLLAGAINELVFELGELAAFRQAIETDEDAQGVYQRLAEVFKQKFNLHNFIIYEVSDSGQRLKAVVVEPPEAKEEIENMEVLNNPALCRVFRSASRASSFHFSETCNYFPENFINYLCLPMFVGGKVIGIVHFLFPASYHLEQTRGIILDKVVAYLQEAAPIIEAKRFARRLQEMSLRDTLTGLYNRRVLEEFVPQMVAGAIRRQTSIGVLMADVDHFKVINDTYGHGFGDRVLVQISSIIKKELRAEDLAIRYGGEEILILLTDTPAPLACQVAERIQKHVEMASFSWEEKSAQVSISIGVAEFPGDSQNLKEVINLADQALYEAKNKGRNQVVYLSSRRYKASKEKVKGH